MNFTALFRKIFCPEPKEEKQLNNIERINKNSEFIRGLYLHHYVLLELEINGIIRIDLFNDVRFKEGLNTPDDAEELRTNDKINLFIKCMDKYETLFNKKFPIEKCALSELVKKRNALAHCYADTSPYAVKNFGKIGNVWFITLEKGKLVVKEKLNRKTATAAAMRLSDIKSKVHGIAVELAGYYKAKNQQ